MRTETNPSWNIIITQMGGWKALLVLVPLALGVFLLAGLMFAVFASVFIVGSAVLAARVWWLKRKLRQPTGPQTLEGDYFVVERHSEFIEHGTSGRHPNDD